MATADELLSTIDTDKTLIIDKDLRTIIIPSSVKNLGVESDDDVLRLKFSMPRMYGDVDLSGFSIYINYMNAKNTGDVYVVDDKTIADDTITFSWLVGRVALAYKGNVRFIVCMKKHDDNSNVIQEYNTTIASLPVLEGLETGETVIQQNPDIIEMLLTLSAPLVGTTQTITPSQVLAAIKEGRDIALQYTDSYYGAFVFSAFNANEKLGIVVSNSILPDVDGLTGTLVGNVELGAWNFKATNTATKDDVGTAVNEALAQAKANGEFDGADGADGKSAYQYAQDGGYTGTETEFAAKLAQEMPTALPNPNALTFTGAVTGSYDGSAPVSVEIPSGGTGGTGETVADVQLASGTIPAETVSNTIIDTGVTLDMLKQYKRFAFKLKGASNVGLQNTYLRFAATSKAIARTDNASGVAFCYEWINTTTNLLRIYAHFSGNQSLISAIGTGYVFKNVPVSPGNGLCGTGMLGVLDLSTVAASSTLKIVLSYKATIDYNWELRGITA